MAQSQTLEEIIPRGIRNNNPLNIKLSPDKFQGELPLSYDETFKQFRSMVYGLRAAFCIIKTYIIQHSCNTLRLIVQRWCGEKGATLLNYINVVSERSGLRPDKQLYWYDRIALCALVGAMAFFETGRVLSQDLIKNAYDAV